MSAHQVPAVYIPTPINPTASTSADQKDDPRSKYRVSTDAYTPTNPAIRIVKRKPKAAAPSPQDSIEVNDERNPGASVRMLPLKGIIRKQYIGPPRPKRSICFADTKNLPLVHIKEIERIAEMHSVIADFRGAEKNEGAYIRHEVAEQEEMEETEWRVLKVHSHRSIREHLSESGRREEKRVAAAGLLRGGIVGSFTLQCDPSLHHLAAHDLANSRPIMIPTVDQAKVHVPSNHMSVIRDLPMPGRKDASPPYVPHQRPPLIQQLFPDQGPPAAAPPTYYATSAPPPVEQPAPKPFELPANLKEMLSKLKEKGLVPADSPKAAEPALPSPTDGFAAAVEQAKQMMHQKVEPQSNYYESEEQPREAQDQGYVATFAESHPNARNPVAAARNAQYGQAPGWTQSGWRIPEPCDYFTNKIGGCNRGDRCRFVHDEELRNTNMANGTFRVGRGRGPGTRGGNHGAFRGGAHQGAHQGGHQGPPPPQRPSRFDTQGSSDPEFRRNRFGGVFRSRFDQGPPPQHPGAQGAQGAQGGQGQFQQPPPGYPQHHQSSEEEGPTSPKRARPSRFDQVQDAPTSVAPMIPVSAPPPALPQGFAQRSRFDQKPHRPSRFDQPQ